MNSASLLSRRTILASAIALPVIPVSEIASTEADNARQKDTLIAVCQALRCVEPIRNACTHLLGAGNSAEMLVASLVEDFWSAGDDCTSIAGFQQALRRHCREDFRIGKIVEVDGWILSLTEARAYALTALSS
jgi:hypothetical protein